MESLYTRITHEAAIQQVYLHDQQKHGGAWTAKAQLSATGRTYSAGFYDVVCTTCNPPKDSAHVPTKSPLTPTGLQVQPNIHSRKELDR